MEKYTVKYDVANNEVIKTLTFMGKEYTEVSKGEDRECENPILEQIRSDFPLPVSVYEAINLLDGTEAEIMEALEEIAEYERVIG